MSDQPSVTIVMPIRNEAAFIRSTLGAVMAQDYPAQKLEVIVADGMSTDGTRAMVEALGTGNRGIHLIDNPGRIASTGLNAAVDAARGDIIIRLDGHALVAPDFVRESVALLKEHPEAWSVGGPIVHAGRSRFGKAVAVAMSHRLGVGDALHRFQNYEGYAEGAQFPALWRWVFERVGRFDEHLVRNQDDEFNYRINHAGGKVYVSPRIRYTYFVRERCGQLFKQYFQYGFWRIPVIKKHRRPTTLRQVAPAAFYLLLLLLLLAGLWLRKPEIALMLPGAYVATLLVSAAALVPAKGFQVSCRVPLAMMTMHAGYAWGMGYGFWAVIFQPWAWNRQGRLAAISR